jgi:hypothetical protein
MRWCFTCLLAVTVCSNAVSSDSQPSLNSEVISPAVLLQDVMNHIRQGDVIPHRLQAQLSGVPTGWIIRHFGKPDCVCPCIDCEEWYYFGQGPRDSVCVFVKNGRLKDIAYVKWW